MIKRIRARYALVGSNLDLIENVDVLLDHNNEIIEIEELSLDIKSNTLIMPGLFNSHVHTADIGLRGIDGYGLSELVGPQGIKQRHLASLTDDQLNESILLAYNEAIGFGTLGWSDFREGGLSGLKPYPVNSSQTHIPFARPEIGKLESLPEFANIGIRDVDAYSELVIQQLTERARKSGKKVFIHISEDIKLREEWIRRHGSTDLIWAIDNLKIDAFVHLTHANGEEIEVMELHEVGGIICLRSNVFTKSGVPPIKSLVESILTLGIGTDNAMFSKLSIWKEMNALSQYDIESSRLLKMATVDGAKLCGISWGLEKELSNLIKLSIPNYVEKIKLKDWLVTECDQRRIDQIMMNQCQ